MSKLFTPPVFPPAHIPVRPEWADSVREAIIEPELPIVDAHHHLWDRPPAQRYLFEDLLHDTNSGHAIEATVYIQCRSMYRASGPEAMRPVGETEFVNGVAARSASGVYGPMQACAAIVSYADLTLGERVRPVLEAHLRAAPDRLRGIRNMTAWDACAEIAPGFGKVAEGLLRDPGFQRGFAELAPLGLSYDVWAFHPQLPEVLDLARRFPETAIIVNHAGGPLNIGPYRGKQKEVLAAWSAGLRELAACPNVTLKLGGLGMHISGLDFHLQPAPPSSQALAQAWRPYVHTGIDLFGPARCMFESNFCVDKGMAGYAVLWNAFKRLAAGCSAEDKAALFSGTARRVYRLDAPAAQALNPA
jgi:L-fuconolactonase